MPFPAASGRILDEDGAAITGVRYDRQVWRVVLAPGRCGLQGRIGEQLPGCMSTSRDGRLHADAAPTQSRLPGPVRSAGHAANGRTRRGRAANGGRGSRGSRGSWGWQRVLLWAVACGYVEIHVEPASVRQRLIDGRYGSGWHAQPISFLIAGLGGWCAAAPAATPVDGG